MLECLPSFCKFHVSGSERKGTPADGRQRGGTNYYYTVGAAERTAGRPDIAGIKIFYTFHVMLSIHRQNLISWSHQLFNYQVKWSATSCLLCVYGLDLLHASVYTRFLFPQVRLHLGGLLSTIKHRGSNSTLQCYVSLRSGRQKSSSGQSEYRFHSLLTIKLFLLLVETLAYATGRLLWFADFKRRTFMHRPIHKNSPLTKVNDVNEMQTVYALHMAMNQNK